MKTTNSILGIIVALLACAGSAHGVNIGLAWDRNPETNIAGYRVYQIGNPNKLLADTPDITVRVDTEEGAVIAVLAYNTSALTSALSVPVTVPLSSPEIPRDGWLLAASSTESAANRDHTPLSHAIDGNPGTFWHTEWDTLAPHYFRIELPKRAVVSALRYLPRQDDYINGRITSPEVELSDDGVTWTLAATATWATDKSEKIIMLGLRSAKYVRLWGGDRYASCSEARLHGVYEPAPPVTLTAGMQGSPDLSQWTTLYSSDSPALGKQFFRLFFHRSDGGEVKVTYQVESNPPP